MRRLTWFFLATGCALLALVSGPAGATPLILDYTGFAWVPSGLVPSHFWAVGVVDGFSQPVNDPAQVYTYYLSNLNLTSIITYSNTRHDYIYSGGSFGIFQSTDAGNRGFDYGTNPANPTSPSTFIDGIDWLSGPLDGFSLYYDDVLKLGTMSAEGTFNAGQFANHLGAPSFFTFSGVTGGAGNGIPQGYRYRLDGETTTDVNPVPEPAGIVLLGIAVAGAGIFGRRRRAA